MTRLHDLYAVHGQSPWIDNLRRDYLSDGRLAELVSLGVRGVTSNPTIMAKAIEDEPGDGPGSYTAQIRDLGPSVTTDEVYWELVIEDIVGALSVLQPVYEESRAEDGYVSIEVDPALAHDTAGTVDAARGLHQRIARPNLYVKIPATSEGVPAIREMVAEGRNINVTLIFSIDRYDAVAEAYISGLETYATTPGADLGHVNGVASFFVSRVDTEVDRRLDEQAHAALGKESDAVLARRGRAAVAQARVAYEHFVSHFSGPRWEALRARGARAQRPLWASTSTKNPSYPDLLYVDNLIGPDTVNTMPESTAHAFLDHGRLKRTVDADLAGAHAILDDLAASGIDLANVAATLEDQGVASFAASYEELINRLATQRGKLFGVAPR